MILRSKDCPDEVIISFLKGVIKGPLKYNTFSTTVYGFMVSDNLRNKSASLCDPVVAPTFIQSRCQATRITSVMSLFIDQLMSFNRQEYRSLRHGLRCEHHSMLLI